MMIKLATFSVFYNHATLHNFLLFTPQLHFFDIASWFFFIDVFVATDWGMMGLVYAGIWEGMGLGAWNNF